MPHNPMARREFLRSVSAGLVALALFPRRTAADPPASGGKPNIIFILFDDLGYGESRSFRGDSPFKMPNLDRLARDGMRFTDAHSASAVCTPTRYGVLTGRYPWQNGEACNHLAYFPADLKAWPEVLIGRGWHVGITGKGWGPGVANDAAGKPRQMTGTPFDRRKAAPPTSAVSGLDYAANFAEFLKGRKRGQPFCFWFGASEPHDPREKGAGRRAGRA